MCILFQSFVGYSTIPSTSAIPVLLYPVRPACVAMVIHGELVCGPSAAERILAALYQNCFRVQDCVYAATSSVTSLLCTPQQPRMGVLSLSLSFFEEWPQVVVLFELFDRFRFVKTMGHIIDTTAGDLECFNPWQGVNDQTSHIQDLWDYQWCTEQFMPNQRDGKNDMFWSSPWNESAAFETCQKVRENAFFAFMQKKMLKYCG